VAAAAAGSEDRVAAFAGRALGSALRLQVRGATEASARSAWAEIVAEFDAVDIALSRFRDDSELTALNRAAGTDRVLLVSWRLREALALMDRARRMTSGRFDPSLADVLDRLGEPGALQPGEAAGERTCVRAPRSVGGARPVRAPARPVDTGGIGKGLALRWAARRAADALPAGAGLLLEAGGDIVAAGEPPAGGWRVGIEDPAGVPGAAPVVVVAVGAGALATSSVRVRHWIAPDGTAVHHLIDPRTRAPARSGLLAVSIAGPDPAWAEVWTKALFLAGRTGIAAEARAMDAAAWWVDAGGRLGLTPAARERSVWVAEARIG
jgi:thiamine biosynthesis lipoprotein